MALLPQDVADLLNSTRPMQMEDSLVDLMSTAQDYYAIRRLIGQHMVEDDGSDRIKWTALTKKNGTFQAAPLFYQRNPKVDDATIEGKVHRVRHAAHWTMDTSEIGLNQDAKLRIFNIKASRRAPALQDAVEGIENEFWSKPTDSTDNQKLLGVKAWIVKVVTGTSAAAQNGGFNGGNPDGYTAGIGEINSTTYTQWANWSHQYTAITRDDAVAKLARMRMFTKFRSAIKRKVKEIEEKEPRYAYYAGQNVCLTFDNLLYLQNDNLGPDVLKYEGETMIKGNPLIPIPELTDDSDDPIYQIDWAWGKLSRAPGHEWLEEVASPMYGDRPTTVTTDIFTPWWQMYFMNRRCLGVLCKAAANPT